MGELNLDLTQEHLKTIGDYVRTHIREWIPETEARIVELRPSERSLDERDRIIRQEEAIKSLAEQTRLEFRQVDQEFKQVYQRFDHIEQRFELIDKRFERIDKRFERIDKRFNRLEAFGGSILLSILGGIISILVKLY